MFSAGIRKHNHASALTRLVVHAKGSGRPRDTHIAKTDLTKAYGHARWSASCLELLGRGTPDLLVRANIKLLDWREVRLFIPGFASPW